MASSRKSSNQTRNQSRVPKGWHKGGSVERHEIDGFLRWEDDLTIEGYLLSRIEYQYDGEPRAAYLVRLVHECEAFSRGESITLSEGDVIAVPEKHAIKGLKAFTDSGMNTQIILEIIGLEALGKGRSVWRANWYSQDEPPNIPF